MAKVSTRNKTIRLSDEERERLRATLFFPDGTLDAKEMADRVICGDLFSVVELLPDGVADLVIVDPPYNLDKQFGSSSFASLPRREYVEYLRSWLSAVCRKLSPTGSIYVCCDWRSSSAVEEVLREEVTLINRITWQREKGRGAAHNWKNAMEDIWFGVRDAQHYTFHLNAVKQKRRVLAPYRDAGGPRGWNEEAGVKYRATCPSNFWDDITIPYWSMAENTEHPTQKPEKLIAKLILASSSKGDLVFDPFGGSGTTAVVAKKLGRRYCSVEIDEEYCMVTARRLELAENDRSIQGYTDGCFWERNTASAQQQSMKKRGKR